jgi:hypothetical protein
MEIASEVKPRLWGAAADAISVGLVGACYVGRTTASLSAKPAQDTANTAVVAALVPFRAVKVKADPDPTILTKFQAEQSSCFRIVMKTGWAPFDGKITGNDALARACAEKLHVPKAG